MKHLMKYEGYTSSERMDDILDKISKYGIKSITKSDREFLDSHSIGKEKEIHDRLIRDDFETFTDDNFKFEHTETLEYDDSFEYFGVIYVPDIKIGNKKITGRLSGKIIQYKGGETSPEFYSDYKDPITGEYYDIFEFCGGLEYELDSFIDYVVGEISE